MSGTVGKQRNSRLSNQFLFLCMILTRTFALSTYVSQLVPLFEIPPSVVSLSFFPSLLDYFVSFMPQTPTITVCLSVHLFARLSVCPSVFLSVCLPVCLPVCLSRPEHIHALSLPRFLSSVTIFMCAFNF